MPGKVYDSFHAIYMYICMCGIFACVRKHSSIPFSSATAQFDALQAMDQNRAEALVQTFSQVRRVW